MREIEGRVVVFFPLGIMATWLCTVRASWQMSAHRVKDNFSCNITAQAVMIGCLKGPQDSGRSVCMCASGEWVIRSEEKTREGEKGADEKVAG